MRFAWYDIVGTGGVALILTAYLLLQLRKIDGTRGIFATMNALGAASIIVSLVYDFNFSAMLVEVFWLLISLIGVGRALVATRPARPPGEPGRG